MKYVIKIIAFATLAFRKKSDVYSNNNIYSNGNNLNINMPAFKSYRYPFLEI